MTAAVTTRRSLIAAVLVPAVVLGGCAVGPTYQRPEMTPPSEYRFAEAQAEAASLADAPFWEVFGDPVLQDLEVCYSGILNPGEVIYVPPFWMHQFVTLDDGNISLPLRFDTTQTPHASLFQLSQQSALRHLTNQPVRDRAKILEFLRTNRGNFRALEREFVAALIDTRGLNETVDGLLNDIDNLRGGA